MKHTRSLRLSLLTLLLCTFLAGCTPSVKEEPPPLAGHSGNYETAAAITYRDLQAEAVLYQGSPGSCSLTFSSPATLADLAFVFRQDEVDISYKGLSYTLDPGTLPGNAVANVAVAAINAAMQGSGLNVDYGQDALTLTGNMEAGEFQLRIDRESGNLIKLAVPAEELEIEFLNFRFLD